MAKLYFRYGAMGSSKTANAIMVQYNYRERGQNALMIKPKLDNRDGENIVGSRSGLSAKCVFMEDLDKVDLSLYNCLIVDEAQFLKKEQVEQLVRIVDERNIPVICYGLRADFQGNLFEGSTWLMAWADTIEEIKTVCWCGRKATWNARVSNGKVVKAGEQIMLGGNESYVALCRKHWALGELAPEEIRKITAGKKMYMSLLSEAEKDESVIESFLENCDLYVYQMNGHGVAEIAIRECDNGNCEIVSLATERENRGKGFAKMLIRHVVRLYQPAGKKMTVNAPKALADLFVKQGFTAAAEDHGDAGRIVLEYDL